MGRWGELMIRPDPPNHTLARYHEDLHLRTEHFAPATSPTSLTPQKPRSASQNARTSSIRLTRTPEKYCDSVLCPLGHGGGNSNDRWPQASPQPQSLAANSLLAPAPRHTRRRRSINRRYGGVCRCRAICGGTARPSRRCRAESRPDAANKRRQRQKGGEDVFGAV